MTKLRIHWLSYNGNLAPLTLTRAPNYNFSIFFNSHAQLTLQLFSDIPAYPWTLALSLFFFVCVCFSAPYILRREFQNRTFTMETHLNVFSPHDAETKPLLTIARFPIMHAQTTSACRPCRAFSPWARTPKITLRYHSGGVMLPYIFENCNYSSFILSMIAMLNE